MECDDIMKDKNKKASGNQTYYMPIFMCFGMSIGTAIEVNVYEITSDRIPSGFDGFRIAQVSDLQAVDCR